MVKQNLIPGLLTPNLWLSTNTMLPSPSPFGIGKDGEGLGLPLENSEDSVLLAPQWPRSALCVASGQSAGLGLSPGDVPCVLVKAWIWKGVCMRVMQR